MYGYPFDNIKDFNFVPVADEELSTECPFYAGEFDLSEVADTYLDMREFGKEAYGLTGIT